MEEKLFFVGVSFSVCKLLLAVDVAVNEETNPIARPKVKAQSVSLSRSVGRAANFEIGIVIVICVCLYCGYVYFVVDASG